MHLYESIPELVVGFDTETTGLDTSLDEAISYGLAVYQNGALVDQHHWFVLPERPIHEGAQKVHGVSRELLENPADDMEVLSVVAGATRAIQYLRGYHARGACFVGSNPMFDLSMLESTMSRHGLHSLKVNQFDVDNIHLVNIVDHDVAIEPREGSNRPRRGLSFLCEHYQVRSGGHHAFEDARASVEVFFAQIRHNQDVQKQQEVLGRDEDVEKQRGPSEQLHAGLEHKNEKA
jgi:DNA polymerase III epsilon subunit-like protein